MRTQCGKSKLPKSRTAPTAQIRGLTSLSRKATKAIYVFAHFNGRLYNHIKMIEAITSHFI